MIVPAPAQEPAPGLALAPAQEPVHNRAPMTVEGAAQVLVQALVQVPALVPAQVDAIQLVPKTVQTIVPEVVLGHVLEDATGVAMGVLAHAKADAARIAKMTARPSAYHLASQTVQKTAVERASFHAFLVVANLARTLAITPAEQLAGSIVKLPATPLVPAALPPAQITARVHAAEVVLVALAFFGPRIKDRGNSKWKPFFISHIMLTLRRRYHISETCQS